MKTICRLPLFVLLILAAGTVVAADAQLKVLVVTGGHGFDKEPFFQMFRDDTGIAFTAAAHASKTNATVYERDDLLSYDAVLLYDMPTTITEMQKARFQALFDKGVGLVVLHHALVSYQNWSEYEQIIGGRYQEPDPNKPGRVTEAVGWQHDVEVPVVIVATNHPVTTGLKDFTIHDEIYWGFRVGSDVTPLITTTHPKSGKPLGWCRTQGKSRVVFIQSGHGKEAFNDMNYRKLLAQAIRWTARGEVNPSVKALPGVTAPKVFSLDGQHLIATRQRLREGDKQLKNAVGQLEREARSALKQKPLSVTDKSQMPPSGDKQDYMSQAPYFWPDPKSATGLPYIRYDGRRNQEIYKIPDHRNFSRLMETVETLGLAYFYTGNEAYAVKASELLRVWFLNPSTRMNPNLEFAQAVPGVNTGRGIGLIETAGLPAVVDAIGLLADSQAWTDADQHGMEEWFSKFLQWMRESKHGRQEAAAKNNHGTYYDVQVVSLALFTGQREFASNVIASACTNRIARQIEPDGRQPLELDRTKSWGYSVMNLRGLMHLADLGKNVGADLWRYQTEDGRGLRKAVDYLLPYASRKEKWPHQQIDGWSPQDAYPVLQRAAVEYRDVRYLISESGAVSLKRPGFKEPVE